MRVTRSVQAQEVNEKFSDKFLIIRIIKNLALDPEKKTQANYLFITFYLTKRLCKCDYASKANNKTTSESIINATIRIFIRGLKLLILNLSEVGRGKKKMNLS